MIRITSSALAAFLFIASQAHGQGSDSSFYVDVQPLGSPAPGSSFAAAASEGGEWNVLEFDLAAPPNVIVTPPLVDTTGAPTGVTLTWDGLGLPLVGFAFDKPNTFGDDAALLDDLGFVSGPSQLTFNGLAAGSYLVLTYAMAPDDPTFETAVSVVGSPDPAQAVGGDFSAGYMAGATHAVHQVVVDASGSLVVDLDVSVSFDSLNGIQLVFNGEPQLGNSYCGPAFVNSSGLPAVLTMSGSGVAADNDLTLHCGQMPTSTFGFFIVSDTQDFVPGFNGSLGTLCLGGAIGSYFQPGRVQNSGSSGEISLAIDLTMTPNRTGFFAAQAGDTLNFQCWFRDSSLGFSTSNLSDGRTIVLE